MSMMMMLGPVFFSIHTAAYEQLQRSTQYHWASNARPGHPLKRLGFGGPVYQYIGPGEDSINLNGTIYPQYKSGPLQISHMRLAATLGIPWPLINAHGLLLGFWIIESVQETNSMLFSNGSPRKIDFSLSLKRNSSLLGFV